MRLAKLIVPVIDTMEATVQKIKRMFRHVFQRITPFLFFKDRFDDNSAFSRYALSIIFFDNYFY